VGGVTGLWGGMDKWRKEINDLSKKFIGGATWGGGVLTWGVGKFNTGQM